IEGYAKALQDIDKELPKLYDMLNDGDLIIISADHGCDPTHHGTDHTREYVPVLATIKGKEKLVNLGIRSTFSDIAATLAEYFNIDERFNASSFLKELEG
ncbi:MAG: phosphopentomutase, partial [Eubacteriales bacterium]|nr:phosphopentomutase [Eubacteriales bacterium]